MDFMERPEYYELDLIDVAGEISTHVPGVASIRLFGSRKYPGKIRSDLDLLVTGPFNISLLAGFRDRLQHYAPLDLWLANGETAVSAINGSTLPVARLRCFNLFPGISDLPAELRRQIFRSDINYKMTVIPPGSYTPVRGDHLGLMARMPMLLDIELANAAEALVRIIGNSLEAVRRMRQDGHARKGKGTQVKLLTEYDFQNLVEIALSPIIPLGREIFSIECQGARRTPDFSFANGRLILELKMAKSGSDLSSVIKDAEGALSCYLNHPGTEMALAVLAVSPNVNLDKNSIESWSLIRANSRAIMRVVTLPGDEAE